MKEINIGQATAITFPNPLVVGLHQKRERYAEHGSRFILHVLLV